MLINKSDRETGDLSRLYDFLGIDPNQDEKALNEATYFACMKVLSEGIGKLPLRIQRQNDRNGVDIVYNHALYNVLHIRPNPYMTASTFWSTVEYNRNHYGNAYVWVQGAGEDLKLWLLPTTDVQVYKDDAKILPDLTDIFYVYSGGGRQYVLSSEEVLHFKTSNTLNGIVGVSVKEQLASTIGGGVKSQKMLNKLYDSGFTAKAVLNYTGSLSDANVKELLKMTEAYGRGALSNDGIENTIPIPVGFSLTPFNLKLTDSQFIETRQYTALQIASAFGIKPYQIGDYTKSSYSSAEAQQLSFLVDTLLYILKQYEEEISYKLLSNSELKQGYYVKFNTGVMLRVDMVSQIQSLSTAVNGFLFTANEARARLDLPAVEGGDILLGNGAAIPIHMAGIQYQDTPKETGDNPDSIDTN